jgi:deazaflavin-dependent oxidoreductase (nitroreductase family)
MEVMDNSDMEPTRPAGKLPSWLPLANRVVAWLQRRGVKTGTIHILTVPGRTTGQMRSTPVSLLAVDGNRYIIAGVEGADWVRNVRASGWGYLAYGRARHKVALTELESADREPILRAFPTEVPHGTQFFERVHGVKADPDQFATLADRCPVFRVEEVNDTTKKERTP